MAAPQLRLEVSLNLAGFRTEVQKLTNIAQSEFAPKINIKFNRRTLDAELNNLQAAIKRRTYRIEIGGNIDSLPKSIKALKEQLSSLESFKIDLGIGAIKSLSKKDASKINSDIRAQVLGEQKKIYVPVSIKPSITREDVRNFKNTIKSKLTGLSVDVKANVQGGGAGAGLPPDFMKYMAEQGLLGKTASGMTMRMGKDSGDIKQQLNDAVGSAEKIKSIFDGVAKSIATTGKSIANVQGKRLGLANVPLMAGAMEKRIERSASAIEGTTSSDALKALYPDINKTIVSLAALRGQVQQNTSKLSGFSLIIGLAAFAGVPLAKSIVKLTGSADKFSKLLDKLGPNLEAAFTKAAFNILNTASSRLLTGGSAAGLLPPAYRGIGPSAGPAGLLPPAYRGIGPSRNAGALPPAYRGLPFGFDFKGLPPDASAEDQAGGLGPTVQQMRQQLFSSIRIAEVRVREIFDIVGDFDSRQKAAGQARLDKAVMDFVKGLEDITRRAILRGGIRQTNISDLGRTEQLMLPSGQTPLMLPSAGGTTAGLNRARITTGAQLGQQGFKRAPSMPPPSRREAPVTNLPSGYFEIVNKYSQALNLGRAATDNFRASQIPFLGGLKNIAGEFGEATKQVLLYGTAYKGLAFVTSLPGQILNAAKSQQQFNNAMQVATQTSGSYAKELLFVDNVQRAFGLDLETTRSGFTRLYASMSPAGFDSGSIEKLFVGISSAMASLQLTPDKAERVIYAFGQMASKGQVMSEELKGQLGDVLPGALAIFASAAGKSVKEFNKEIEDGVYSGAKFRDLMSKVTEELITRFGSGASAAARSLQGLMNIVKGDFTRLLESFAPLANSAAEAILKPLGGALRQLSVATKLATGERGRLGGQVTKQEKVVQELGAVAAVERGGPNEAKSLEQYKGAKQSLAALNIELDNLNELAKDPAIAQQAEDIKAFANEIGKAGNFVKNFAMAIGGTLSPILNFLGTNLTAVIGTIASLTFAFQGSRLALLAFAGVMTVVKGVLAAVGFLGLVQQVGSFSAAIATSGGVAKAVAAIFTSLGIQATAAAGSTARSWAVAGTAITFASGATIKLTTAMVALAAVTGFGLIAAIGLIGAAFSAMGQDAKQAAEDSKQAAKDMAEAARKGNVPQVEAGIRQASADAQLIADAQNIVRQRSTKKQGIYGAAATPTLSEGDLSEAEKNTLTAAGISLPKRGATRRELLKQLNDLLAEKKKILQKGKSQLDIAEKQQERIGLGIPDLGLQGTEKPEDPNAEKAAQRGKVLLDAIEQREEAITKARKQREEDIAKARKDAIENAKKLEESLAKERIRIEREVAKTRRDIATVQQNIGFVSASISASLTGGDTDLVRIEQEITEAARKRNEDRITLEQQLADQQTERTKSIEALKKTTADAINEANARYAKAIGDAQREYAKASAKIIEEGTGRAGKRLEAAAKLAGALIEQSSALSAYTSGTGRSVRVDGPNSFAVGRGQSATADEFRKTNKALELLGIAAELVGEAVINTTAAVTEAERAFGKLPSAATSSGSAIQQVSVNTADLTRNLQAANRAITGVGDTLRKESDKLGGQQFFLEYQKQMEKAVQGLGQARQSAEDEVKKTRAVLAARRQGLTGDQAESLYSAKLLRFEALEKAQKVYNTKLSKTPPEEQQALTDDFEQKKIEIEGAYIALVQFNDALYNTPAELKLSVAIVEARDRLRDLLDPVEQIKGAASSIGDAFGEAFKGIITGSMTAREALAGMFQSIADRFADMVAQMIAEYLRIQVMEGMQNILKMLAPGVGAAAGAIGGGLSSGFSAGASSAIDTGAAGWGAAFNTPLKFANGGVASGGFTAFANGGIVTGPTLGLVGEGRYNEAVIPLPDGKSVPVQLSGGDGGSQISSNIVVNVNNGQAQSNATGSNSSELGRKIEGAVKQVIVGELRPGGLLASR